jgi:hypothetical protein
MNEDLQIVQRDIDSPPGGWRYTVPETGVTIKAPFFNTLKPRVIAHLKANHVVVDDERLLLLEDGACRETRPPGSWCAKRPAKPVEGGMLPLLIHVERFLKTVWGAIRARQFVSREEANRRIAICLQCPKRAATPGGCQGCYTLLKKAATLMEKNDAIKIEPDEDGYVRDTCSACWCVLPLKVWLPQATLDKAEGEKRPDYAPGCWRNE